MTRDQLGAWVLIAIALAIPTALIIRATLRHSLANAREVIDQAPTKPTIRATWACCGHEDCTCGTGLGDVVEAWLAGQNDRPYNWAEDEGSGLR